MAKVIRLLGKPPEGDNIRFRKTYLRGDGDDRFVMRRPSDFYTSIFAYGGRGRNRVELPFSSSDSSYSSITRSGNVSLQFLVSGDPDNAEGESNTFQTIQVNGVRRISLLDQDLRISRIYRNEFGSGLPTQPRQRRTRWISNGRWDGTVKKGELDILTGKSGRVNNFYLSRANNDAIIRGSNSKRAIDTLFFDEYVSEVDIFSRNRGRVNIRVTFTADSGESEAESGNRSAVFKGRNLERLVLRDAYFERRSNKWRRFNGKPVGTFEPAGEAPQIEPALVPRQPKSIFNPPEPGDIFNTDITTPPIIEPLA